MQDRAEIQTGVELQDYLTVDEEVVVGGALTLDEIVQTSTSNNDETIEECDKEMIEVIEQEPVKSSEARQGFQQFRRYFRETIWIQAPSNISITLKVCY